MMFVGRKKGERIERGREARREKRERRREGRRKRGSRRGRSAIPTRPEDL